MSDSTSDTVTQEWINTTSKTNSMIKEVTFDKGFTHFGKFKTNSMIQPKKCVVSWGVSPYDILEAKDVTHNVTNIFIDSFSSMVEVTIQKGLNVSTVAFSMEHAQEIGFINIKALKDYCK